MKCEELDILNENAEKEYPFIIIEGLLTSNEVLFINELCKKSNQDESIDLYIKLDDVERKIGVLMLHLGNLLKLRKINPDYKISLHLSEDNKKIIDLNDGQLLEKFIYMGGEEND